MPIIKKLARVKRIEFCFIKVFLILFSYIQSIEIFNKKLNVHQEIHSTVLCFLTKVITPEQVIHQHRHSCRNGTEERHRHFFHLTSAPYFSAKKGFPLRQLITFYTGKISYVDSRHIQDRLIIIENLFFISKKNFFAHVHWVYPGGNNF